MSGVVASTNLTKTSRVREIVPGVTPNNPVWNEIIKTSFGLKTTPTRGRSKDVRSDGQAGGSFLLDAMNDGAVGAEHKFKHFDDYHESSIKGVWNNKAERDNNGTADSVITAVAASSDTYTVTDGVAIDFAPGMIVLASGFAQAANNLRFRAAASTNGTSVISPNGRADEAAPPAAARLKAVGFEGEADDITATATGIASTLLDFTTFNMQIGEWHYFKGEASGNLFAATANRGRARVSNITAHAIDYDILPAGWQADAGTGKSIQVYFPDFVKNGTTVTSYSHESQQLGIATPLYEYFKGDFVNQASIQLTGAKEIDLSFEFVGMSGTAPVTSRFAGSADRTAPAYGTMTANLNVGDLFQNNVSLISGLNCMSQGSIKINNNINREPVVGGLGNCAIVVGSLTVSGEIETYLGDETILVQGITDTLSGFSFPTHYASGNREGYVWDVPAIKITPTSDIPGGNQGRKVAGPYEAEPHAVLGYTISICRYWYLPN